MDELSLWTSKDRLKARHIRNTSVGSSAQSAGIFFTPTGVSVGGRLHRCKYTCVHSASSITHKHGEAGVAIGLQDSGRGGIRAAPGLHLILARASDGLDGCETTNQTVSISNLLSSRQS
jgi:hypothetical protein